MEAVPQIVIKKFRLGEEARLFLKFLNHPIFLTHRHFIIRAFPELERMPHKQDKKGEQAVRRFLRSFYNEHKRNIIVINRENQSKLKKNSPKALRALGEMMQYRWEKKRQYWATPTVLPFSPFGEDGFYFSILGSIFGKTDSDCVCIAIHEISHFIFFDMLREIEKEEKIILARDAAHYLKEALTAALLDMEPLRRALNLTNYHGNPEIRELYIKPVYGRTLLFKKYISRICVMSKKRKELFYQTLKELVLVAHRQEAEFSKKRSFWNCYSKQIFSDEALLREYRRPIKIKGPIRR